MNKWKDIVSQDALSMLLQLMDSLGSEIGDTKSGEPRDREPKAKAKGYVHVHVVAPGDTLWSISKKYLGTGARWNEVYQRNRDNIRNPDVLYPGQSLEIFIECSSIELHQRLVMLDLETYGSTNEMIDRLIAKVRSDAYAEQAKFILDQLTFVSSHEKVYSDGNGFGKTVTYQVKDGDLKTLE